MGWGILLSEGEINFQLENEDMLAPTMQMWHYRARLLRESRFSIFGRLANEYIVDMFTRDLECRLNYIKKYQHQLPDTDGETQANDVYLPASFLGSRRWASNQISDALALAANYGPPMFFVTMTCNPRWSEITSQLRPGQDFSDIPVVVCRVFKQRVAVLINTLSTMFHSPGRREYLIERIEFQKRGLPHTHILIKFQKNCATPGEIDEVISAEVPCDPADAELVKKHMMHKHPPLMQDLNSYCQRMVGGRRICRFGYPKPLQQNTVIDGAGRIHYRRRKEGDKWVVPHCLPLLRKFHCHLNFEASSTSDLFQYIFKYIHKGDEDWPVEKRVLLIKHW
jgi:hypothetical protein